VFHILTCLGIVIFIFLLVISSKFIIRHNFFQKKLTSNPPPNKLIVNKLVNLKIHQIILFSIWILLLILEITKYIIYSYIWHDHRIWLYLSIHICSLPMYLLPILIFTKSTSKFHKVIFNFLFITAFICLVSFAIGFDTPDLFDKNYWDSEQSKFYAFHSYIWHSLLVLIFVYLSVFQVERLHLKINLPVFLLILGVNIYIFFFAEILKAAGISGAEWILYNQDDTGIFKSINSWCKSLYLTNFILLICTTIVYEGCYFAYFYIDKATRQFRLNRNRK
jgi:hypothetical protein